MAADAFKPEPVRTWMTAAQAAGYVGVSLSHFRKMVKDGRMPQPRMMGARLLRWYRPALDEAALRLPCPDGTCYTGNLARVSQRV